jgi:periplasmic protein CpxP/Spy
MKKQFLTLAFAIAVAFAANAQGGGGQRMSAEERIKFTIEKMAPLNLDAATKAKSDAIITEYINAQQKAMEEIRVNGGDRDAMMAKRRELADARDAKLKSIFTEAQMKQWKDEIEPSLRPQRPAGGGGK